MSERDIYKEIDDINDNVSTITNIFDDAKDNDPEFYGELVDIFKEPKWITQIR